MKTIEVRRHSIRSIPNEHLNQSGVQLARLVGESLGPFDRVVTSTLPRAFETAIAMGFAVDEQVGFMSTHGFDVERDSAWPNTFAAFAQRIKQDEAVRQYATKLARYYAELANYLGEGGAALVINHGGVVELGVTASCLDADYKTWGGAVDYCEGARLFWANGTCVNAELLRVSR